MVQEQNTLVITYIDSNYDLNLECDFLSTLRKKACYHGKVIVMDYGIDKEVRERTSKLYNVEFIDCKKDMSVCAQRYRDIPDAIDSQEEAITNVLIIDGGDVWFQNSIQDLFNITSDRLGCIEEKTIIGEDEWTDKCLNNLNDTDRNSILELSKGKHVKNSGMVCGPRELVSNLIRNVAHDIYHCGMEFFGIDQLYFNYEFLKIKEEKRLVVDSNFNFVLITNKEDYYMKEDMVYRKIDNQIVTVVHNAGGAWRILKRPFANRNIDEEQYIIENVKKIHI